MEEKFQKLRKNEKVKGAGNIEYGDIENGEIEKWGHRKKKWGTKF